MAVVVVVVVVEVQTFVRLSVVALELVVVDMWEDLKTKYKIVHYLQFNNELNV